MKGTLQGDWRAVAAKRVRGLRYIADGGEGWSMQHLATVAHIEKSTVVRVEKGEGISVESLIGLARAFGVSVDFLVGRERVPAQDHELVDRVYEKIMSLASSLEFTVAHPGETTVNNLRDTLDMLRRAQAGFVSMASQFRHPDGDYSKDIPYGYEFMNQMEQALGEKADGDVW